MKKYIKYNAFIGLITFSPLITYAVEPQTLRTLAGTITDYLQIGINLIIAFAVITFIWNVYRYFFTGDPKDKKDAGAYVLYSTIGFFVILSLWGLVALLRNSLKLNNEKPSDFPSIYKNSSDTSSSGVFSPPTKTQ